MHLSCILAESKLVEGTRSEASSCSSPQNILPNEAPVEIADEYSSSIGEDADVVMMHFIAMNLEKEPLRYSYDYLFDCREKLMQKVEHYRSIVEKQSSEITAMKFKQCQEIEHIREFYQAIAYAPTRSSRIVKRALCSTKTAAELLRDIGLEHVSKTYKNMI